MTKKLDRKKLWLDMNEVFLKHFDEELIPSRAMNIRFDVDDCFDGKLHISVEFNADVMISLRKAKTMKKDPIFNGGMLTKPE